jgi:hypothetical protein
MTKRIFKVIAFLVASIILSLMSSSCGGEKITPSLGEEFTLPVGEMASIEGESLSIKFIEVISDSRCPQGVVCVWAGEAQCRLQFSVAGSPAEMVIVQPGGGVEARDYFVQYKIDFRLEPYPQEGQEIAPSDYRLVMTITK